MISCSMIHWLIGAVWLCTTNASQPRTDSRNRTKISPLAKSKSVVGVGSTPRLAAISSVSSGCERPESSTSLFWLGAVIPVTDPALSLVPSPTQVGKRSHRDPRRDRGAALELCRRADVHARRQHHAHVDPGARRVDDRHPGPHPIA